MQRAIIAGILIAIISGIVGPFLLFKRMSFMGVGISHGTFAGIAIALLLNISPTIMAVVVAISIGFLIGVISRLGKIPEDSAIGTMSAFFMALGIFLINLSKGFHVNVMGYLFGDILAISTSDVIFASIVFGIVVIWLAFRGRAMLYLTFDEDFARITGVPVEIDYYIFMVITSLVIVTVVRLVGVVLAGSILIATSAAARMVSKTFPKILLVSVIFGIISVLAGITFSYGLDISSGTSIVFFVTAFFFGSILWRSGKRISSRLNIEKHLHHSKTKKTL